MPSVNADAACCCVCISFVDFSDLCEGESAGRRRTLTTPPQISTTMDSAASPLTVIPAIAPTAKPLRGGVAPVNWVGIGEAEADWDVVESVIRLEDVKFDVGVVEVKTVV